MSTRMPILRIINENNPIDELFHSIRQAPPFDIQVAADIQQDQALRAKNQLVVIDQSFGRIRAPYPSTWMEWHRGDYSAACWMVQRAEDEDNSYLDEIGSDQLLNFFFKRDNEKHLARTDFGIAIRLTDEGGFNGWAVVGEPLPADLDALAQTWLGVCITALSLVNCKNVTTKETGKITLRRNGTQKRRGETAPVIKYHTIILPGGGGTESDGKGGHRATAIHRVRGHFKTFTAERPLMGQHVGTYWWGWQVRGNTEKGVVVSDYKLAKSN